MAAIESATTQTSFLQSDMATTSFSAQVFKQLLSSNIFFQSNMQERVLNDLGSIRKSVNVLEIDIFETKKSENTLAEKSFRCLLRAGAGSAIGLVVAPIGVVWHTCNLLISSTWCTYQFATSSKKRSFEPIWNAGNALFADSTIAFCGALCPYLIYKYSRKAQVPSIVYIAALVLPILVGVFPSQLSRLFPQNTRLPFYKSVLLKNDFGIVGKNGQLLSWDAHEDREYLYPLSKGHFGDIYIQQGYIFCETLFQIKQNLALVGYTMQTPPYPPTHAFIAAGLANVTFPDKERLLAKLKREEKNIKQTEDYLSSFLEMQENSIFHYYINRAQSIKMPKFSLPESTFRRFFYLGASDQAPKSDWQNTLVNARQSIPDDGNAPNDTYLDYKNRIHTCGKAHKMFNLNVHYTEQDVNKAFRRVGIIFHPDKFADSQFQSEAEEIFKFYSNVKAQLLKDLE